MNKFYVLRWRVNNSKRETESVTFKKMDNRWHEIVVPGRTRVPFFSPDGKTMHFGKRYKERTKDGWSEMKSLGSPFEEIRIMSLTVSNKGTYVFDEVGTNGDGVIRHSRLVDGKREEPKPFSKEINAGTWNAHPFIAPDESYIMWDGKRESGYGNSDLYISFRQPDGSWGEAINLGDKVNTDAEEGGPQVTPDGKYLFFNRVVTPEIGDTGSHSDLYWVDAQIIEDLRPKQ
jgi:Tol biopolymer transport system component